MMRKVVGKRWEAGKAEKKHKTALKNPKNGKPRQTGRKASCYSRRRIRNRLGENSLNKLLLNKLKVDLWWRWSQLGGEFWEKNRTLWLGGWSNT